MHPQAQLLCPCRQRINGANLHQTSGKYFTGNDQADYRRKTVTHTFVQIFQALQNSAEIFRPYILEGHADKGTDKHRRNNVHLNFTFKQRAEAKDEQHGNDGQNRIQ